MSVVENFDPGGSGCVLHQRLDFGLVDISDFVVVIEVIHRTGLEYKGKTFTVQAEFRTP